MASAAATWSISRPAAPPGGNRGGWELLGGQNDQESSMFKFIGGVAGIIFLIGLLVVIGILSLIF